MIRVSRLFVFGLLSVVAMATPRAAQAQTPAPAAPTPAKAQTQSDDQPRVFVGALGGMTLANRTGGQAAVQAGVNITPNVSVFAEVGRLSDILSSSVQNSLLSQAAAAGQTLGTQPTIDGHLPVTYFMGAVRFTGSSPDHVAPFAEVGYGIGHVTDGITASTPNGDVTASVVTPTSAPYLLSLPQNEGMLQAGGGITMGLSDKIGADIGIRLTRIFISGAPQNLANIYGAVHIGF
jgi:hypothetical protein